jgi:hypothetical protein
MALDSRAGKKVADFARSDIIPGMVLDPGPYIGKIKNTKDPARLGRIQVYIPELSSGPEDDPINWKTVSYCSPFFGSTVQPTDGNQNDYGFTKETYGFWMTPPDVGSFVMCIFIRGKLDKGYYIGCLPDETAHFMVPGLAGAPRAKVDTLTEEAERWADGNQFLPVTEFNQNQLDLAVTADLYYGVERPVHYEQLRNYYIQGLASDNIRGIVSSSSQRESPSRVFGFSTPGKALNGNGSDDTEIWQRAGGHSLVLDDGDARGEHNMIRLRTSAGHQIMMNDSAGIMYVITASGKNWIELGADGSMRVFSESDITMHSESTINFIADGSFNINTPSFNVKSDTITFDTTTAINFGSLGSVTVKAGSKLGLAASSIHTASATATLSCDGALCLVGDKIKLNSSASVTVKDPPKVADIPVVPTAEPWINRPAETVKTDSVIDFSEKSSTTARDKPAAISTRPSADKGVVPDIGKAIAAQPDPAGGIGTLTKEQTKALLASIGKTESGGDYRAVNTLGFSGKYQFGVAALEDMGYVKSGSFKKYRKNSATALPEIWSGKDGINSREDWLNSPGVQEQAMFRLTSRNYQSLVKLKVVTPETAPGDVAGLLKVAHLLGPGGARDWAAGKGGKDAYGTSGDQYFAQGKSAVDSA